MTRKPVLLALLAIVAVSAAGYGATVTFHFDSAGPGDPVGDGDSGTFTGADGLWTAFAVQGARFGDVSIDFEETTPGTEDWTLRFAAQQGDELLVGSYPTAETGFVHPSHPTIDLGRNGMSCGSGGPGDFEVFTVAFDIFGRVMRFVGDFVQACDGNDPELSGSIDFSTDLTLGATSFTEGNLVVISRFREEGVGTRSLLAEYTTGGSLVQVMPILRNPGSPLNIELFAGFEYPRDVIVDRMGNVQVFTGDEVSGDSRPFLSTFEPTTGNWTHRTFSEWDLRFNAGLSGSMAAFGDYVFSADMAPSGNASGVIRWDTANNYSAQRFADGTSYDDVTVGLDGRLYALREDDNDVLDLFDPVTLDWLGTVTLARTVSAVAVDARGRIFATRFDDLIYEFDPSGIELNSLVTTEDIFDIDISRSGQIAVGTIGVFLGAQPVVLLTDTTLTSFSTFLLPDSVGDGDSWVAFVEPPPASVFSSDGFESGDISAWARAEGGLAGFLDVNGTAAEAGSLGLEVTVGGSCSADNDRVITSPPVIEGDFFGCNSITASGVSVGPAGASFVAGAEVTLGDDFTAGSLFDIALDPALLSGLAWVGDDSPAEATSYNADFDLRLDDLTIAVSDLFELFNGYSSNGDVQFKLILKRNLAPMEDRLVLAVRRDDGTFAETPAMEEIMLPASWNSLRIRWLTGASSGSLLVSVNGSAFVGLTGIDNDAQQLHEVRLGYVGGTVTTSTGTFDIDNFSSWQ